MSNMELVTRLNNLVRKHNPYEYADHVSCADEGIRQIYRALVYDDAAIIHFLDEVLEQNDSLYEEALELKTEINTRKEEIVCVNC